MRTNKRRLYESIMKNVSKTVKKHLDEITQVPEQDLIDNYHYKDKIKNIINDINNLIYDNTDNIDKVIWDLLDGISDNGQDDMIMIELENYCKQH